MPKTDFNRRVTLQKRVQAFGSGDMVVESAKTIWGAVENVSLSFRTNAEQSGLSPSLFVHLWRHEFESDGFTHCIVGGTEYRITMTGTSMNEQYVKLMLTRG